MFHLSLYTLTPGGALAGADMPGVSDPAVTLVNNHPIFQVPVKLVLAYLLGNAQTKYAQILTPKLQGTAIPTIRPIDNNTTPATRPPVDDYAYAPLSLNPVDENAVQLTVGAGAQVANYAALWFSDGVMNSIGGDTFTIHGTATPATNALAWTSSTFILDRPLPAGNYAVVGYDIVGANLLFARLIFPSQPWRPGILAGTTFGFINCPRFRFGRLGTFGIFSSYAQPNLDLFMTGAPGAVDVFLDVVKVG